ncbi:MAG: CRISPR-associated endonuclease Cas1 [Gordonia sp. (in: high G+C Gram-positive bacteria)]|uniref:CRISPR-associated endonuclease Cas1 n=1 Tax=Gordonia sp. (in: high G+C Gram-positive bacteria) TaxID=84139 RepID=UPI0039E2E575
MTSRSGSRCTRGRQGSRVFIEAGRLIVESKDSEELVNVPKTTVARITCFGAVTVSAGTRSWALTNDVDVAYLSRRGKYQGQQLSAASGSRVERLRAQVAMSDDETASLRIAREMIETKISHQECLLHRLIRREKSGAVAEVMTRLRGLRAMIPEAATRDELLGVEGAAAAAYFSALGQLVPESLRFDRRSKRPPEDMVNSALSYGYAILVSECVAALIAAGLDPNIGLLHKDRSRRPSLALDLMEEFRPMIVDQVVMVAARRGALKPEHAAERPGEPGVHLNKAGKSALVGAYEKRMLSVTGGAIPGFKGSIRRHLYKQAGLLAHSIIDPDAAWFGTSWR